MTFQAPILSLNVPVEPLGDVNAQTDQSHWYHYRRIIRDVTELYHGHHRADISATQILELHKRYTKWREELSASLGDIENQSQALPHVLTML